MPSICKACKQEFPTAKERIQHVWNECMMKIWKVHIDGGIAEYCRNEHTGKLDCYCKNMTCDKQFQSGKSLYRHLKNSGAWCPPTGKISFEEDEGKSIEEELFNEDDTMKDAAESEEEVAAPQEVVNAAEDNVAEDVMEEDTTNAMPENINEDHLSIESAEQEVAAPINQYGFFNDDESVLSYIDPVELPQPATTPPRTPSSAELMQDIEVESEEHIAQPTTVPVVDWRHTELVPNAYLESIGLTATSWGGLCCLSCGVAFTPEVMLSHLKKNAAHKFDRTVVDQTCFEAALDICNINSVLPPPPTTLVPSVSGLALCQGVACGLCSVAASTEASLLTHYRTAHREATEERSYEECFIQRFNNTSGVQSSWFKVQHVKNVVQERTVLDTFLAQAEQRLAKTMYDASASNDPRTVAPWLLSTGWHKEVQGLDAKLLCVTVTAAKEFKGLREAALQWISSLKDLEDTVIKHIRKRINTDKLGELNNMPFGTHMFTETMDKYAAALEGFLAMLLRPQGAYQTPFTPELTNVLATLDTALVHDPDSLPECIDHVLQQVWEVSWRTTPTNRVADPTERFVMLKSLNMDGSWGDVRQVTPLLAKLKYLMRVHFMRRVAEAHNMEEMYNGIERWCKEGQCSTFDTVCDLQHRASQLAMQAQGPVNLYWTDDSDKMVLRYKGDEITLDALRTMFKRMEQDAKRIWEQDVMLNSGLSVSYEYIKEDLENRRLGYSFLEEQRNGFSGHRVTLLQHIVQDPTL
ncbi:hypothetical protein EIP86_009541, partial [Pleurotus ostreatoroseus]